MIFKIRYFCVAGPKLSRDAHEHNHAVLQARMSVLIWNVQIPLVADLPVGENLQDQVIADGIEFFTPYSGFTVTAARAENFLSAWGYSLFGTGR